MRYSGGNRMIAFAMTSKGSDKGAFASSARNVSRSIEWTRIFAAFS
jgi:hypothetical protein